jgi:hypothetical protein
VYRYAASITASPIALVFYVMSGMVIGLVAAFFLVDRGQEDRLPVVELVASSAKVA